MQQTKADRLMDDFLSWSGGFPPDSDQQIFVYIETSCPEHFGADFARTILKDWMTSTKNDEASRFNRSQS